MTEPAPAQEPQQQTPPVPAVEPPPWGDDFDPARAWHTITTLRDREKELTRQVITDEQQKQLEEYSRLVEASKSEQERKDEELARANTEREQAASDALRFRIAIDHGVDKDDIDLLGRGSEEELTARAQRIAELRAAAAQPTVVAPPARNVADLKPGAVPPPSPAADDVDARHQQYAQYFRHTAGNQQ